ncbi:MAG: PD40 domain-containing protein [Deltaproteobacteria bacterium]|nr:PD40 domain-containing protein [Deltaproteobacteria bacterium]
MMRVLQGFAILLTLIVVSSCSHAPKASSIAPGAAEKHFKSLKQLTFDGTNAEAYFSPDGKKLIFQGHTPAQGCDQVYTMNVDGTDRKLVSVKGGRNTCSYFLNDKRVLFSSTHEAGAECPKERDRSKGYVWEIFKSYDIYTANPDGSDVKPLTRSEGYDAESTVCGGKITFTSAREGHSLAIYSMNVDGTGVEKLTHEVGYNGGPFFSPDCTQIVYRAYHPRKKSEIKKFKKAISEGYVPPSPLEIFVMKADGSEHKQLTHINAASFAPSFYPNGKRIIYSSNRPTTDKPAADKDAPPGRVFQLWGLNAETGNEEEAITAEGSFNGFPMFSPDGKYLVFASNRNSANPHELEIFLAEWQD